MKNPLKGLNKAQLQAATTLDQHTTVLSCPGSGKTRVLEAKVSHILQSVTSSFVCCTTFSKEGVNEIRTRIISSLPSDIRKEVERLNSKRLITGTFHGLCYQAMLKHYRVKPNIVHHGERQYLLRKAAWQLNIEPKGEAYDDLLTTVDLIPTMTPAKKSKVSSESYQFFNRYKEILYSEHKIDFDDLLVKTLELLESGEMKPTPYTHLICDEGQDNDDLMRRWLYIHAEAGAKITLLLDDDQCLYSFRNALGINICIDIEKKLGAKRITNSTNYRSHKEILSLAGKLIEKNEIRVPKELVAHRGIGGKTHYHELENQFDTINLIQKLITPNPGNWFVLCRTNADIREFSTYLIELGIPYKGPDGVSLFDLSIVQTYIELIKSLSSLEGAGLGMTLKAVGIKDESIQILESQCSGSLASNELASINLARLPKKDQALVNVFFERVENWRIAMQEGRDSFALRRAGKWLLEKLPDEEGANALQTITKIMADKLKGSTHKRIATLNQMIINPKNEKDDDLKNKVHLMTAHSSKGLQRKAVLLWNLRDGCYPASLRDGDDARMHLEEERRVLYVAMTRAEDELHLVFQKNKVTNQSKTEYLPSPFLYDMKLLEKNMTKNIAGEVNIVNTR